MHKIQGSELPKKQQKWRRTELPTFKAGEIEIFSGEDYDNDYILDWDSVRREEHIKQTGCDPWNFDSKGKEKKVLDNYDLSYVNPKLEAFRQQELKRIKEGHWFMNNGTPVYLPGFTYGFFNWWKMDVGYPEYRHYLTEFSYVIEWVRQHPKILGVILASMRGIGKTYFSIAVMYFLTIMKKGVLSGMQSKTEDSADGMWNKLTACIMELPDFLIPVRKSKDIRKDSEIEFFPPGASHPNPHYDRFLKKNSLKSKMNYMGSADGSYDSETLYVLLQDEIGKIEKPSSVTSRFNVTRNCVLRGSTKRGFILGFTTVGDMEKGPGTEFKTLFEAANQYKAKEKAKDKQNWTTPNDCVSYFLNDQEATYVDEYGYSDTEKSTRFHDMKRQQIEEECKAKGDMKDYIAYCQNNPRTINDAFMLMGKGCVFNATVLQQRQIITTNPDYRGFRRGDLVWVDKWKKVQFVENQANGLWTVSFMPEDLMNTTEVEESFEGHYNVRTKNNRYFSAGMDPTSHKKVQDKNKASKPTITIRSKYHPNWPDYHCSTPAAHYVGRIESIKEQAEDAIKAAIFFGCDILIEKNKSNVIQLIQEWGFNDILVVRPEASIDDPGITSNASVIELYTGLIKDDINPLHEDELPNGQKLKHPDIIEDCLEFDPKNTTAYDSAVSYGLSLISAKMDNVTNNEEDIEISDIFQTYAY